MPYRAWLFIAALGLALSATLLEAQEQAEQPNGQSQSQQSPAQYLPRPFPVEIIENEAEAEARERSEAEARQREIDDLEAQQGMNVATQAMNEATQSMVRASWVSTFLVFLGTILLGYNMYLMRQANRAAFAAVAETRRMGHDQARAYVSAEAGFIEVNRMASFIFIQIKNSGATPATWLNIHAEVDVFDADSSPANITLNNEATGENWGSLPNGALTHLPTHCPNEGGAVVAVIEAKGLLTIRVYGRIRYGTIFGETYETMFTFHTNDPNLRTPVVVGDDVPISDHPCKMFSPPGRLVAYKRIHECGDNGGFNHRSPSARPWCV